MPQLIATTVYRIDELPEGAKDSARAWYREGGFDHDWYDAVYEDFQRIAEILGVRLKTRTTRLVGGRTRPDPLAVYVFTRDDAVAAFAAAVNRPEMNGVYNLCAPGAVTNAEFLEFVRAHPSWRRSRVSCAGRSSRIARHRVAPWHLFARSSTVTSWTST